MSTGIWMMRELPTRHELHFGDRVMRCFIERPASVNEMLLDALATNPAGEALVVADERLTWRALHERVMRCAAGLAKLGIGKGDRVATLVGNGSEFVIANLAIPVLGAIIVPMSTREQMPGLSYILNHCTPKALIHDAEFADRVPAAADIPSVEHRVAIPESPGCLPFTALLAASPLQTPATVSEDDAAAILYTSGTTGRPKGGGADAPRHRALRHALRGRIRPGPGGPLRRGRPAYPRDRPRGHRHADGPLRGHAHRRTRLQGEGLSGARRARAHHVYADGAVDVQPVPASATVEEP